MNQSCSGESVVFRRIGRAQMNRSCSDESGHAQVNRSSSCESVEFK